MKPSFAWSTNELGQSFYFWKWTAIYVLSKGKDNAISFAKQIVSMGGIAH